MKVKPDGEVRVKSEANAVVVTYFSVLKQHGGFAAQVCDVYGFNLV